MAWLRKILATQIAQQVRFHHRQRRDVNLERRLAEDIDRSAASLGVRLIDTATSPSLQAVRHEREVLLADALAEIKPEHREVIILRNLEELSFDEVGRRMGRTATAVKSLWVRALAGLRRELGDPDDSSVNGSE
jgi:RNA polymerase sigma-70 factor (ECF subfamily)